MPESERVSIGSEQSNERWQAIVTALLAHGIGPDIVTFAALTLGTAALGQTLGVEKAKRSIGFISTKAPR